MLRIAGSSLYPVFHSALPFDFPSEFKPVSKTHGAPFVIEISAGVPAHTLPEFIAYAKANPGKLNFGSANVNAMLPVELFMNLTGLKLTHIPYRGNGPELAALIANEVQLAIDQGFAAKPQVDAGRIRVLAVASRDRSTCTWCDRPLIG